MAYPTNPSYVRRIVRSMGQFEAVKVSPGNGDVSVKAGGKWSLYGTTKEVLAKAEAAHSEKYGKDAERLRSA